MRTSLRRALAAASATVVASAALALGAAPPAAAETSYSCPSEGSIRLVDANDGYYRVWLYQPSPGEVFLCFKFVDYGAGVLIFRSGAHGSLVPDVTVNPAASDCAEYLHLTEPADVLLQLQYYSVTPPMYLCFGANGNAVGVDVEPATGGVAPGVELWLDYYTILGFEVCWATGRCGRVI